MDIKEIKVKKKEFEISLKNLLNSFQKNTETKITDLRIYNKYTEYKENDSTYSSELDEINSVEVRIEITSL